MSEDLKVPNGLQVAFGLQAQGHIPLILHKLADAGNWDDIGKAIGWHPETAHRHFEWWIDAQARPAPAPVTDDEWAQLASDCGVTPACESRDEFVALMRQAVEQAGSKPAPVTVSDEMVERAMISVGALTPGIGQHVSVNKYDMKRAIAAALAACESARGAGK